MVFEPRLGIIFSLDIFLINNRGLNCDFNKIFTYPKFQSFQSNFTYHNNENPHPRRTKLSEKLYYITFIIVYNARYFLENKKNLEKI